MARVKQTTITEAAAASFLREAGEGKELSCDLLPGFKLKKMVTGGVYRWRYSDPAGRRRTATVGRSSVLKPDQAAGIVRGWIESGADPLSAKQASRVKAQAAEVTAQQRQLAHYLSTTYASFTDTWGRRAAKQADGAIRKHFAQLLQRDMSTICKADIRAWRAQCDGLAFTSIKRYYSVLQALLNRAVQDGTLAVNPIAGLKLDPPGQAEQRRIASDPGKDKRRLLTDEELRKIQQGLALSAVRLRAQRRSSRQHGKPDLPDFDQLAYPHWFEPFCLLALHTGMRPGDIYSLTWTELSVAFGRLTKTTGKSLVAVRNGKAPALLDIKLNATIQSVMKTWHEQQGSPASGLVFPGAFGRQLSPDAHKKAWATVKQLGELDAGLDFYSLRHNFISRLVVSGVPLLTIAKMVGQKSASMIEQHYGHLCAHQAAQAVDIVGAAISRASSMEVRHGQ